MTHNEINGTVVPGDLGFGKMVSANKADFIGFYCNDPVAGAAFARTLGGKAAAKKDPVTNKADARKPSFAADGRDPVANKLEQFEQMPEGPAKERFQRDNAAELLTLQRQRG